MRKGWLSTVCLVGLLSACAREPIADREPDAALDASVDADPDACVQADAMQPPPPPRFLVDAIGEENANLAAATCVNWQPEGPMGYHPRPEQCLPDGRMECDSSFERVPEEDRDSVFEVNACIGWPYRPPTPAGLIGGDWNPRISCSPDRSLCCQGWTTGDLACGDSWTVCPADYQVVGEAAGMPIEILVPTMDCPQDVIDAFPTALNGCHYLCQHICPELQ